MKKYPLLFILAILMASCTSSQISKTIDDFLKDDELTTSEVALGLKQALEKGTISGTNSASKEDGYFKNPKLKIPLPPEIQEVESKLRSLGLNNAVEKFLLSMNRAAEAAADEAKPIFVDAIKAMTIQDAWEILRGSEHEATNYLKRNTYDQLKSKFQPEVKNSMDQVNLTRYYNDFANIYNRVPGISKINPDLDDYVTSKAIDGLFVLIAEEEEKIRENPAARTTELLKKVFARASE